MPSRASLDMEFISVDTPLVMRKKTYTYTANFIIVVRVHVVYNKQKWLKRQNTLQFTAFFDYRCVEMLGNMRFLKSGGFFFGHFDWVFFGGSPCIRIFLGHSTLEHRGWVFWDTL